MNDEKIAQLRAIIKHNEALCKMLYNKTTNIKRSTNKLIKFGNTHQIAQLNKLLYENTIKISQITGYGLTTNEY